LEHVFKKIGFANKGNAMKTIEVIFTLGEDYKILHPNGRNLSSRVRTMEEVVLSNRLQIMEFGW
jgi:hypothetical protein